MSAARGSEKRRKNDCNHGNDNFMSSRGHANRARARLSRPIEPLLVSALSLLAPAALAQQAGAQAPPPTSPGARSAAPDGATQKLIQLLVERKLISEADAAQLLKDIQAQGQGAAQPDPDAAQPGKPGEVRVPYIPESVRNKITQSVEEQLEAKAKAENWAQPNTFPDWARRLTFFGDFRFREELDRYNKDNSNQFIDYSAINTGSPFDVSATDGNTALPPFLDTTADRQQPRIRLRFGVSAQIDDNLSTTFRFASGNTTNPVSTNQTLGSDFNKYTFVIDQAFLNYSPSGGWGSFDAWLGRIPKPFVSTDLVWYDDLSFDGLAARWQANGAVAPFVTGGAFSVENTALDFPETSQTKLVSHDKTLLAGQLGLKLEFSRDVTATTAVAFYDFHNIQGRLSNPCVVLNTTDSCDSDDTRPEFQQRGNTVFALRDLVPAQNFPNGPLYQFFGLASAFREADAITVWDFKLTGSNHLILTADYVYNTAFHAAKIAALNPVNNLAAAAAGSTAPGSFVGGDKGFQLQMLVGQPEIERRWQWNVLGGYKHLDSDAVVDAFDDPDFMSIDGVGGTNEKGYFVFASLGLAKRTWLQARWFSGTTVSGAPLSVDTVQVDLNAGF